jgi:YD repeat-containing protein
LNETVKSVRAADVSLSPEPGLVAHAYEETVIRDANGNVIRREVEHSDALDGAAAPVVTEYTYDILDQLIEQVDDAGGEDIATTFEHDENGNVVRRVRAAGRPEAVEETWTYDDLDKPITHSIRRSPTDVATTQFITDDNGNVVEIIDAERLPSSPTAESSVLTYDGFDRVVMAMDRTGAVVTTRYDAASNPIEVSRFGKVSHLEDMNWLLSSARWRYDARGRAFAETRELFQHFDRSVGPIDRTHSPDPVVT